MGLREDLGKLLGHATGPMPRDCEDPAYGAGLPPGLEELLGRGSRRMLGEPPGATGPSDGASRTGA